MEVMLSYAGSFDEIGQHIRIIIRFLKKKLFTCEYNLHKIFKNTTFT